MTIMYYPYASGVSTCCSLFFYQYQFEVILIESIVDKLSTQA